MPLRKKQRLRLRLSRTIAYLGRRVFWWQVQFSSVHIHSHPFLSILVHSHPFSSVLITYPFSSVLIHSYPFLSILLEVFKFHRLSSVFQPGAPVEEAPHVAAPSQATQRRGRVISAPAESQTAPGFRSCAPVRCRA